MMYGWNGRQRWNCEQFRNKAGGAPGRSEGKVEKLSERQDLLLPSETAARSDVAVFNKYIEYKITKAQAMKEIAANNYLAEITEEQFINELILLGWYVPQRKGKDK